MVLENNSPRVMRNFGLEYATLWEVNPEIIMVSISGFGQTGPDRNYVAYGANIEASCGLAAVTGYADDDRPYRSALFYADPVTGAHAAIATLAALRHRAESGRGVVRTAAPLYGEHNRLVLKELLGMTDDELAPLYARRAIADLPGPVLGFSRNQR